MIAAIAISLVVILACAGLGAAVLRLLQIDRLPPLERFSLSCGLGFGCVTMALFGAGILGLLFNATLVVLIVPAAVVGALSLAVRRAGTLDWPAIPRFPGWSSARALTVLLFVICAAVNVVGALTPPNFIDALIHHLYVPKQFLLAHAVVELTGIWQHYQPMASELLYMIPLAFGSPKGASLLCAAMGLLAAAGTYLLGARLAGSFAGILAATIFYSNAMVAWESTSCFVDLAVAALGTLGFWALIHWVESRQRNWLAVSALLLGFAASCKLNAASFAIAGVIIVAGLSARERTELRLILSRVLFFGIAASLPVVPWLVRSWILTGNPLYPFATPIFGANNDRAAIDWVFAHYGVGYSGLNRLLAPWHLFTQGAAFENGNYLSPLPVLMAPIIIVRAWTERGLRALFVWAAVILIAIWSAGGHVARYILPIEPLLSVLAADALCWLGAFAGRRRVLAFLTGGAFLLFGTASTVLYDKQFLPVAFGRESDSQYLRRTTWYYDLFREVCEGIGPKGRILTNAQKPTFYLDCSQGRANDQDFADPSRLRQIISDGHFTDILLMENEGLDTSVDHLGSEVQLVWRRKVEVLVSRTFGRTAESSVAWYHVNTN